MACMPGRFSNENEALRAENRWHQASGLEPNITVAPAVQ
jgi:hypothetical protein